MSIGITASAPGKVVLSGEYAVLDGATAVAMAINYRAIASVRPSRQSSSTVTGIGHTDVVGKFTLAHGALHWQSGREYFAVLDVATGAVRAHLEHQLAVTLDTRQFIDAAKQSKIGVGSSAAITVSLCAALARTDDADKLAGAAYQAHRDLQQGVGSGVDIATSLHGGLIAFQMKDRQVTPLQWPQGLCYQLVFSGVSASTPDKLAKLAGVKRGAARSDLCAAANSMSSAWQSGVASAVVGEYRHYVDCLRAFSEEYGLGVFGAGHDELEDSARAQGLVYKPCGAGGGDIGIVLGLDEQAVAAVVRTMPSSFTTLDCQLSATGVSI